MPLSIILALCLLPTFQAKAEKAAEKERLKSPARITINAPAADVKALILTESVNSGWRLVNESESRLVLQRTPESTGQRLSLRFAYGGSAGNPPQQEIAYTLAPSGQSVIVIADVAVVVQRFGGSVERYNWNADKTQRAFTDAFLTRIKKGAEGPAWAKPKPAAQPEAKSEAVTPAPVERKCYDNGRRVPCATS